MVINQPPVRLRPIRLDRRLPELARMTVKLVQHQQLKRQLLVPIPQ
jgi:hypothetical protein